ncbi:LAFE_0H04368g1_1 [Lachancea fermentati]|uniref:LAFE_0H04368g1_1 n=1 Tax=Lachancea fermentati TaxID=4955 RepID=A0A1G4MJH2_LACFM|nr:LAFE_0H04368g1_1 [Lachancea fermentati]
MRSSSIKNIEISKYLGIPIGSSLPPRFRLICFWRYGASTSDLHIVLRPTACSNVALQSYNSSSTGLQTPTANSARIVHLLSTPNAGPAPSLRLVLQTVRSLLTSLESEVRPRKNFEECDYPATITKTMAPRGLRKKFFFLLRCPRSEKGNVRRIQTKNLPRVGRIHKQIQRIHAQSWALSSETISKRLQDRAYVQEAQP